MLRRLVATREEQISSSRPNNNNMKRKRSKADKDAKQRAFSIIQYRKQTERDPAPWVSGDGTEEDALKALVRYHGSTNVAMLLHTDNERIKSNIRKFVRVSPEVKATMRKTWQEGEMATSRAYYSCAIKYFLYYDKLQPAYSYNHTEWLLVREGPSGPLS